MKSSMPVEKAALLCLDDSIRIFTSTFLQNEHVISQSISMNDPASLIRMKNPCRSFECNHIQCFDLDVLISMNKEARQERSFFKCPVCNERRNPEKLYIDYVTLAILRIYSSSDSMKLYNNGVIQMSPREVSTDGLVINSIYDLRELSSDFNKTHFNMKTILLKQLNYTSVYDINNMLNTTPPMRLYSMMKLSDKNTNNSLKVTNDIEKLRPFCSSSWDGLLRDIRFMPGVGNVRSSSIVENLVKAFESKSAQHLLKISCGPLSHADGESLSSEIVIYENVASSQVFDMTVDLCDDEDNHTSENNDNESMNTDENDSCKNMNQSSSSSSSGSSNSITNNGVDKNYRNDESSRSSITGAINRRAGSIHEAEQHSSSISLNMISADKNLVLRGNICPIADNVPFESIPNTTTSNAYVSSNGNETFPQMPLMNNNFNRKISSSNSNTNNRNATTLISIIDDSTSATSGPSVSINSITSHPLRHKGSANWTSQAPPSTVRISRGPQRMLENTGQKLAIMTLSEKPSDKSMKKIYCFKCTEELQCSNGAIER